jgi:hypothetical protein
MIDLDFEMAYNTYLALKSKINITSSVHDIFINQLLKSKKNACKIKDINLLDAICKQLENKIINLSQNDILMKKFLKIEFEMERMTNEQRNYDYDAIIDLIDNIYREYRNYDKLAKIFYDINNGIENVLQMNQSLTREELIKVYEKKSKLLYGLIVLYNEVDKSHFINLTYSNTSFFAANLNTKQLIRKLELTNARLNYLKCYERYEMIQTDEGFMNLIFSQRLYHLLTKHSLVIYLEKNVAFKLLYNISLLYNKLKLDTKYIENLSALIEYANDYDLALHLVNCLASYNSEYIPFNLVFT